MLVQPTQPEVFASQPEPAARRLGDTVAHLQEETQQRARLAHQALDEFVREKVGPNGRNEPSSADTLSKLEPADAQKLRALQDYAAKTREELYRGFESLDGLRRELEKPRGHEEIGRNLQAESTPDQEQVLSMNRHSSGRDLQLANGSNFEFDRNSTVGGASVRTPETLESRSWFVDSDQKWHFDSLPVTQDATPERDFNTDLGRDDIGHDLIYGR